MHSYARMPINIDFRIVVQEPQKDITQGLRPGLFVINTFIDP